jgi:hypothetical protein
MVAAKDTEEVFIASSPNVSAFWLFELMNVILLGLVQLDN